MPENNPHLFTHHEIEQRLVANNEDARQLKKMVLQRTRTDVCFETSDQFITFVGDFESAIAEYKLWQKYELSSVMVGSDEVESKEAKLRRLARELATWLNSLPQWPPAMVGRVPTASKKKPH